MDRIMSDLYRTKGDGSHLRLKVIIGQMQSADVWVQLGGKEKHRTSDSRFEIDLGSDQDLDFVDIKVVAHVTDIQTNYDKVTMTVIFSGGREPEKWVVGSLSEDAKTYYLETTITPTIS